VKTDVILPRREWIKRINSAWEEAQREMMESILKVGRELIRWHAYVKEHGMRGEWTELFESGELNMTRMTAHMLMTVANDERIVNYSLRMPPHWHTLYKITRLDDDTFDALLSDGTIGPNLTQNEIGRILRKQRVAEDERRVLDLRPIQGRFRTLVLDPAWEYDWLSIAGRAKPGYAMQTHEQLLALDVAGWSAKECQLYCWVTNNFMARACQLIEHWGFQHRTVLTWVKPPPFGLGSYFRNSTEHVLFATLGETTTRPAAARIPTHIHAPRGEHSAKPQEFYDIVQASSYPPYGEANQRQPRSEFVSLYCEVTEDGGARVQS
jgi:N6-adenosine-specific RNA methylase IME4